METEANTETNTSTVGSRVTSRCVKRSTAILLAFGLLMAACGSSSADTAISTDDPSEATTSTELVAENVVEAAVTEDAEPPVAVEGDEGQGPPPGEGGEGQGPPPGEGGESQGPPPGEGGEGTEDDLLTSGPQNVGEHGPFSNADLNGDVTVTRAELDEFMDGALEREIGLVAFFDLYDTDSDDVLDADEQATVDPAFAFDGTDANADDLVSLAEVTEYANEEGRSYRAIGLGEFFDLVDTDGDNEVSPEEIEAAHVSGLLARF